MTTCLKPRQNRHTCIIWILSRLLKDFIVSDVTSSHSFLMRHSLHSMVWIICHPYWTVQLMTTPLKPRQSRHIMLYESYQDYSKASIVSDVTSSHTFFMRYSLPSSSGPRTELTKARNPTILPLTTTSFLDETFWLLFFRFNPIPVKLS